MECYAQQAAQTSDCFTVCIQEIHMLAEKPLLGLRGRKLQGESLMFALEAEDDELQASARAAENGLASKTLVKQGPMRITLVTLRKGAALQAHQVEEPRRIQM